MRATMMTRTSFDSASLSGLASIAHPMQEEDRWRLELMGRSERAVGEVDIVVQEGGSPRIGIDLARPMLVGGALEAEVLAPNGMINLNAGTTGRDAGFALLYRSGTRQPAWDSRLLARGDHYACMPFRPGTWRISNLVGDTHATVRVNYPDPRAIARGHRLATGPVYLHVRRTITALEHAIDPGQALVFAIDTRAHLAVELVEADDGPAELVEWRAARSRDRLNAAFPGAGRPG